MIYTFDPEHRLTSVGTSAYAYDGAGTRLRAIHSGIETKYLYDLAGNLLAEADANGVILSYYLHGLGLLAMITPQDETFSYHYDGTGNTIVITDQAGNTQNTYAYTPFGIRTENEAVDQPFTFSGEYGVIQEPTGLYYMRARYYDPILGRFISEDPISFAGGDVNLFAYVGNNPINFVDPWGLGQQGKDHALGRTGVPGFEPGRFPMRQIEDYVPTAHEFAVVHDKTVDILRRAGVPDIIANVPTMPAAYVAGVLVTGYDIVEGIVEAVST